MRPIYVAYQKDNIMKIHETLIVVFLAVAKDKTTRRPSRSPVYLPCVRYYATNRGVAVTLYNYHIIFILLIVIIGILRPLFN